MRRMIEEMASGERRAVIMPDDLLTEDEIYRQYDGHFADRELRDARKRGEIRWINMRKGPRYLREYVSEYILNREQPLCAANPPLSRA